MSTTKKSRLGRIHTQSIYAKATLRSKAKQPQASELLYKLSIQNTWKLVREDMDWFYPRRGPEWKQGWTGQTMASLSLPPLPLLAVFAIVIFLLSLSQSSNYKEKLDNAATNFQLFLFLVPIVLILLMRPSFTGGWFNFWTPKPRQESLIHRSGGFPWGIAILVVVLLVLVSYQSSFHSKWFAPLRRSDY